MPKHQPEDPVWQEDPVARRQRIATGSDSSKVTVQSGDFGPLPDEIQLAVARKVADLPYRRHAPGGFVHLRRANKRINPLILEFDDLEKSNFSLKEYPGIESRRVVVCHDVVDGPLFRTPSGSMARYPKRMKTAGGRA